MPVSLQKWPALQGSQSSLDSPMECGLKLPAEHGVGRSVPGVQKCPGGHLELPKESSGDGEDAPPPQKKPALHVTSG